MPRRRRTTWALATLLTLAACASPTTPPATGDGPGRVRQTATGTPTPRSTGSPGPTTPLPTPSLGLLPPTGLATPGLPTALPTGPVLPGEIGVGVVANNGAAIVGKVKGPAGIVTNNGASLIGINGGAVISNNGGGVISNNGGGVVSNNGGAYRLLAVEELPYQGIEVALQRADGTPVLDAAGKPITDVTKADGSFRLPYAGGTSHVVAAAKLPADRGAMLALVPRGQLAAPTTVDLDLTSTLTMGYILDRYVRTQADPGAVLERLPPALEAETRQKVGAAVAKATTSPPAATPAAVVDVVERLRTGDTTVDAQLEEVRRVLLAGLSDQGAGQPADAIETDAIDVAVAPSGEVIYAGATTRRIWKKDAAGRLTAIAGSGLNPIVTYPTAADPAPGDGGPATESYINPVALAYAPDGSLLIADLDFKRVRQVSPTGTITTRAAHADWGELRDILVEPDGTLVAATHSAIWRVPVGGTPTLIAGEVRAWDAVTWVNLKGTGDGGLPSAARFASIQAITRDPRDGAIVVYDGTGQVRKLGADAVTLLAGAGTTGATSDAPDGTAATAAQLSRLGSALVRADGSLVIADLSNHRVREVVDGKLTTILGTGKADFAGDGGPARQAGTVEPRSLLRAPDGTIYFTDGGYVRRLAQGEVTTVMGGTRGFDAPRPSNQVQLNAPAQLRYDAATHAMYVLDSRHVWRWSLADDRMSSIFGGGLAGTPFAEGQAAARTTLFLPRSLITEGPDKYLIFASDPNTYVGRILRVQGGAMTTVAGGALEPGGMEKDGPALGGTLAATDIDLVPLDGWLYYNVLPTGRIRRLQEGGNTERWAGNGTSKEEGSSAATFDFTRTYAMALGPDGQLYVSDHTRIYRVDPATKAVTLVAGNGTYGSSGDGGPARDARVAWAAGFAWDAAGDLYFSEPDQACVRRVRKATGVIERVAGERTPLLAGKTVDTGLSAPGGLAFDKHGDLYIADLRCGQVKVILKSQLPP